MDKISSKDFNVNKLDKIVMSHDEMFSLFEWRDNHKDYVRNFKPVLKEGLIALGDGEQELHIVFQEKGKYYVYTIFKPIGHAVHQILWDTLTKIGTVTHSELTLNKEGQNEYNSSIISLHASLMAYMEYYSDKKEYVEVNDVVQEKKKERHKKKGGSKKRTSVVKIRKKVIKINVPQEATIKDKKRYERKTESWTVSGHWRHMKKTGKKVWIPSYTKGSGEKSSKIYKF